MKLKKFLVIICVIVLTTLCFIGCTQQEEQTEEGPIKIGASMPLTGPAALAGSEMREGVLLALEEINNAGGVLGRQIELLIQDDASTPAQGASIVRQFLDVDKVVAMVGPYSSPVASAQADLQIENRLASVLACSTAKAVLNKNIVGDPVIFRLYGDTDAQAGAFAKFLVGNSNFKNFVILHENTDYGKGLEQQFTQIITSLGGNILFSEGYDQGTLDFSTQITKISRTPGVDAVYLAGILREGAQILQTAYDMGHDLQFVGGGAFVTDKLAELASPQAIEGLYIATSGFEPGSPNQVGRVFSQAFQAKYDRLPGTHEALAYDALRVIVDAIDRAGSTDREAIIKALQDTKEFMPVIGEDGFKAEFDERGQAHSGISIAKFNAQGKRDFIDVIDWP